MLGFAFAIHILMTAIVVVTILWVMDGRASTSVERAQADSRRRETRTPTRTKPVAIAQRRDCTTKTVGKWRQGGRVRASRQPWPADLALQPL